MARICIYNCGDASTVHCTFIREGDALIWDGTELVALASAALADVLISQTVHGDLGLADITVPTGLDSGTYSVAAYRDNSEAVADPDAAWRVQVAADGSNNIIQEGD